MMNSILHVSVEVLVALTLCSSVSGQHPGIIDVVPLDRSTVTSNNECAILGDDNAVCSCDSITIGSDDFFGAADPLVEEDPMLVEMPGYNFKAYKRADISSFYQESYGSRTEVTPAFRGQAAKFQNISPQRLELIWDAGNGAANGSHICTTGPFESCGTSSFETHRFYFVRPTTKEVVCSFDVVKEHSVYYCDPFVSNDPADQSAGVLTEPVKSLDTLTESEKQKYEASQFNRDFAPVYKNFTGGSEWLGQFPTKKPNHFMWPATFFGQEHLVTTKETHFINLPPADQLHKMSITEMKRENSTKLPLHEWRDDVGSLNLTLTVVSVAPRYVGYSCLSNST
jgi:hypothetical protein